MRPIAPSAVLSQDGRCAVHASGARLTVIDTASGQVQRFRLPFEAGRLALSPDGTLLTAADHQTLGLFRLGATLTQVGQASLTALPYRLKTASDGTTVATFNYNDEEGRIGVWRGEALSAVLEPDGASLGETLADFVWLDAPRQRFLIWGQAGPGAFGGSGAPYSRLFAYEADQVHERWTGQGLPFSPNGFVMPLKDGTLGAYQRERLVQLDPDQPDPVIASFTLRDLEKVVSSPDGRLLAWLWTTSLTSHIAAHLAWARLGSESPHDVIAFQGLGAFEQFAIADDGQLTLIYGTEPDTLHIFRSEGERLVRSGQVQVTPNR